VRRRGWAGAGPGHAALCCFLALCHFRPCVLPTLSHLLPRPQSAARSARAGRACPPPTGPALRARTAPATCTVRVWGGEEGGGRAKGLPLPNPGMGGGQLMSPGCTRKGGPHPCPHSTPNPPTNPPPFPLPDYSTQWNEPEAMLAWLLVATDPGEGPGGGQDGGTAGGGGGPGCCGGDSSSGSGDGHAGPSSSVVGPSGARAGVGVNRHGGHGAGKRAWGSLGGDAAGGGGGGGGGGAGGGGPLDLAPMWQRQAPLIKRLALLSDTFRWGACEGAACKEWPGVQPRPQHALPFKPAPQRSLPTSVHSPRPASSAKVRPRAHPARLRAAKVRRARPRVPPAGARTAAARHGLRHPQRPAAVAHRRAQGAAAGRRGARCGGAWSGLLG
jgi:hypothetical protein